VEVKEGRPRTRTPPPRDRACYMNHGDAQWGSVARCMRRPTPPSAPGPPPTAAGGPPPPPPPPTHSAQSTLHGHHPRLVASDCLFVKPSVQRPPQRPSPSPLRAAATVRVARVMGPPALARPPRTRLAGTRRARRPARDAAAPTAGHGCRAVRRRRAVHAGRRVRRRCVGGAAPPAARRRHGAGVGEGERHVRRCPESGRLENPYSTSPAGRPQR